MLGLAGYAQDRKLLGMQPETPVYIWHFGDQDDDNHIYRNSVEYRDNRWQLRTNVRGHPTITDFAANHRGNVYYTINEPTYTFPKPSAKELAYLHANLTQAVSTNGVVASPGFAQTETGISWWGSQQYDQGPDGKQYTYVESFLLWLRALDCPLPNILQFHAYPRTRNGQSFCDAKSSVSYIKSVCQAMYKLRDRYWNTDVILALTEVGWIDYSAGGSVNNSGWSVTGAFMSELINAYLLNQIVDHVCWFIPRSEACTAGKTGGWPGYLIYSAVDPNGSLGISELCNPYWFTVKCQIDAACGPLNTLTPLGKLWSSGVERVLLTPRLYIPILQVN